MSKGRIFLGALFGAIIGVGLLVLSFWLAQTIPSMAYVAFASWLVGGFVAGLIASSPGRGALAGFLTALIGFIINSLIIVLLTVFTGSGLLTVIFGLATFGMVNPADYSAVIGILIAIGILISLIVSAILGVTSIIAGLIGGAINNPNRSKAEAYQEYPDDSYR
ncbi:MAG: hypothetical protein KAX09_04315 [Candidatus Heimdallarchaeota archaeon]|nr:hypothetical protein [Candidatus Heimdallarchaeota archaeon]MCK4290187.1 hypothetical protein [Candidatus Heimdallarchaeota archaeon]